MISILVAIAMQTPSAPSQIVCLPLSSGSNSLVTELTSYESQVPADEIIPSLNLPNLGPGTAKIEIRSYVGDRTTKWYDLGTYSATGKRGSVKGQKDADGDVATDTLRLTAPTSKIDIRITRSADAPTEGEVFACFSSKQLESPPLPTVPPTAPGGDEAFVVDGRALPVPALAQGDYIKGEVLCSPTSLAMVLEFWAKQLDRPELAKNANEVSQGVWDPIYDGGGNWAFNVAFAGIFPGIRSYVTRLSSIADLELWVNAGFPIECSVASSRLHSDTISPHEHGHLIVVTGFTPQGDVITNDPGHRDRLQPTYKRADFEAAWLYSRRTVYIVQPISKPAPKGTRGMWIEG